MQVSPDGIATPGIHGDDGKDLVDSFYGFMVAIGVLAGRDRLSVFGIGVVVNLREDETTFLVAEFQSSQIHDCQRWPETPEVQEYRLIRRKKMLILRGLPLNFPLDSLDYVSFSPDIAYHSLEPSFFQRFFDLAHTHVRINTVPQENRGNIDLGFRQDLVNGGENQPALPPVPPHSSLFN